MTRRDFIRALVIALLLSTVALGQVPTTVGWSSLGNGSKISSYASGGVCPASSETVGITGDNHCPLGIYAYSGDIVDDYYDRVVLPVFGGHNDYCGTEMYDVTLNGTPTAQLIANSDATGTCNSTAADYSTVEASPNSSGAKPNSRHTYNCLVYVPPSSETASPLAVLAAGKLAHGAGPTSGDVWVLNLDSVPPGQVSNPSWTHALAGCPSSFPGCASSGTNGYNYTFGSKGCTAAYDAGTKTVLIAASTDSSFSPLWKFRVSTNELKPVIATGSYDLQSNNAFAIDPVRRLIVTQVVTGGFKIVDISTLTTAGSETLSAGKVTSVSGSACSALDTPLSTFAYDPVFGLIVGYTGTGKTVYLFNPDATNPVRAGVYGSIPPRSCIPVNEGSVTPPTAQSQSSDGNLPFGRFRYSAKHDAFIYSAGASGSTATNPVYSFRLNRGGLGSSTLTCMDVDGDGYGTGPGCTGPDADDGDVAVHTYAQGVSAWGSAQAFFAHLGYTPLRYWVMAATGGNDGACTSHTFASAPDPAIQTACATWAHIEPLIQAGDMVLWRSGTYTSPGGVGSSVAVISALNAVTGTVANPIIYRSFPGELPVLDAITGIDVCAEAYTPKNRDYITIEGFKFIYSADNVSADRAINVCANAYLTIKHNEVGRGLGRGFYGGAGGSNWLVQNNVLYDQNLYGQKSHAIYMVNRSDQAENVNSTFSNNIVWNPGKTCIQNTGPFSNLVVDGNVCYNLPFDAAAGLSWEQGVHNSFLRNNLVFNADVKALAIADYESTIVTNIPHDQNNNIIENNTFVIPKYRWENGVANSAAVVTLGYTAPYIACGESYDLGHQTFRNNLFVNYSGWVAFQTKSYLGDADATYEANGEVDPRTWLQSSVFQKNFVYPYSSANAVFYSNKTTTIGSPPCSIPAQIEGYWNLATFLSNAGAGSANNTSTDPLFTAYNDAWWGSPSNYNLRPSGSSPALSNSTTTTATFDILGNVRSTPATMGAYEVAGSVITVTSVSIQPTPASIAIAGTQTYTCVATWSDASSDSCPGATWASTSTSVATISAGTATAVAAGTTTITATYQGMVSNGASLTVLGTPVVNKTKLKGHPICRNCVFK